MTAGLRLVTERAGDGAGQPVLDSDDGEELVHVQPGVSIVLGNRPAESPGTLYISSRQVVWLSDTDRGKGYAVDFLSISLHAVSRDPEAYPSPCIYTQIEAGSEDEESDNPDSDNDEALDLSKITELRFVPSDPNQLDSMFEVFCECAELNPDPIVEDEGEHDWVFSEPQPVVDELMELDVTSSHYPTHPIGCSNGAHDLANDVLQLQIQDGRFDDADVIDSKDDHEYH